MSRTSFVRVWGFEVPVEHQSDFEATNGVFGDWERLFSRVPGYVRTRVFRDVAVARDGTTSYVVVDEFADEKAWSEFEQTWGQDYQQTSSSLAHLAQREALLFSGAIEDF
ncbi:MAG: hypothetical protein R2731_04475 [Nocardioides sp.]